MAILSMLGAWPVGLPIVTVCKPAASDIAGSDWLSQHVADPVKARVTGSAPETLIWADRVCSPSRWTYHMVITYEPAAGRVTEKATVPGLLSHFPRLRTMRPPDAPA